MIREVEENFSVSFQKILGEFYSFDINDYDVLKMDISKNKRKWS